MIKFNGGYIPDPEDKRDFPATRLLIREVALPESYIVNPNTIIYDQGQTPKCVAHSSCGIKTDEEFLEMGQQLKFDANWLYAECKKIDGIPNEDGTYPRVACKIMNQKGCKLIPVSAACPVAWAKPKPPEPTPDEIFKYHIDAYYRIDSKSTIDFVKQIIFQFGSIETASWWYDNWMAKFDTFPSPSGTAVGGHAYRTIGWNPLGFVIANSWGKIFWGRNGVATMPYSIFKGVLAEGDCWKIQDHIGK